MLAFGVCIPEWPITWHEEVKEVFSVLTASFSHGITIFSFLFIFSFLKARLQRRALPGGKRAVDG